MRHIFRSRPVLTEAAHRATMFEIFFDLVLVLALTRLIAFMGEPPTFLSMAQGLLVLLILMLSWEAYTWLGNRARADRGLVRAGTVIAMAAIFAAALVIPDAWQHGHEASAPLALAAAYIVIRAVHFALYSYAAAGDRQLHVRLVIFAVPSALGWVPLIFGAVLAAALLGLAITFCLWWLFFENAAAAASQALAQATGTRRDKIASDAYGLGLLPLIAGVIYLALGAGVIYLALGTGQVLAHLARNQPQHPAGQPLSWTSATALYGGVVLYLTGRLLFLRLAVRSAPPAQLTATGVALLLLPTARGLPALAALGLLTAFLAALVGYERLTQGSETVG